MAKARPSRILRFTAVPGGGLRIAAVHPWRSIELEFRAEHALVQYRNLNPVVLPWGDYGKYPPVTRGTFPDGWVVTYWDSRPIGVAVRVDGHLVSACHDIDDATHNLWRRYQRWFNSERPGTRLPLAPKALIFPPVFREVDTLRALASILALKPEYRAGLADPARVERLAVDLGLRLRSRPVAKGGARRDTIDVLVALQKAGYVHRYGRPLSRAELPSPETVLAATRVRLESNPYRKGRHTDDATITRVARAAYLDVEPWPFGALVDD